MNIAIVGAGISGLTSAYYLCRDHDVTVFESASEIGGHTATKTVSQGGDTYNIDTGFIVYNDWTYPNFIELMNELNVPARASEMSFSVSCEGSGLEYAGSNLNTLFADRKNLVRPVYWKMLKDIVRFNREAISDFETGVISAELSLGEYLDSKGFGRLFKDKYLVPMGAAIWSSTFKDMEDFPALFFVRFFKNHGLLQVKNRPQWYTIVGGSRSYLTPLTQPYKNRIHTDTTIHKIDRVKDGGTGVQIEYSASGGSLQHQHFDALVLATHSDQALELLSDATDAEKSILSSIPYSSNEVVLHTDTDRLPKRRLAWSSWNYRLPASLSSAERPKLTYDMNILQGIESDTEFCVSLNQTDEINADKIIDTFHYSHPVFTAEGMKAQQRWSEIAGSKNTWYCGAYWANGFHEDGVVSALNVVESINQGLIQKGAAVA